MAEYKKVKAALKKKEKIIKKKPNVLGTAVGHKIKDGRKTKDLSVVVFVKEKLAAKDLKRGEKIPKTVDGVPTDVVVTGEIKALVTDSAEVIERTKLRPAPGGVSVGHYAITAGTLGKWVRYGGVFHILSNNHVLANSNGAQLGDNIIQPGAYDMGINSDDKIAELSAFVPIDFSGNNLVDAAIAKVVDGGETDPPPVVDPPEEEEPKGCNFLARSAIFIAEKRGFNPKNKSFSVKASGVADYVHDTILNIGNPTGIVEGVAGLDVKKMGRTTGLTHGTILYTDASVDVSYGAEGTATFVDQLIAGDMSAGGDSGSIIVTEDGSKIVGLLFAGSDTHTIFNRIQNVIDAFPGLEVL